MHFFKIIVLLYKLIKFILNLMKFSKGGNMKDKIIMWLGWVVAAAEALINFLSGMTF